MAAGIRCVLERLLHPKAAYWVFTPAHDNLGDHAIAQAEKELFSKYQIKVIEVTGAELQRRRELGGLTRLMNGRPILVHGGGFLGTLWFQCEMLLRDVIRQNRRSKILVLPNTVYYQDSPKGHAEQEKSVEIYNAHPNLTIYTREQVSYQKAGALYRDVRLMPDMVMYMNKCRPSQNRSGCILCLRADHEKTRTEETEQELLRQVKGIFQENISFLDMCSDHTIAPEKRDMELELQYDAFRNAELVVTDRLHGMIFCAIPALPVFSLTVKVQRSKAATNG